MSEMKPISLNALILFSLCDEPLASTSMSIQLAAFVILLLNSHSYCNHASFLFWVIRKERNMCNSDPCLIVRRPFHYEDHNESEGDEGDVGRVCGRQETPQLRDTLV